MELEVEPIDPAVHVLVSADIDANGGGGLAPGDHGRVIEEAHLVDIARAGHERHRVQCAFNWSVTTSARSEEPQACEAFGATS